MAIYFSSSFVTTHSQLAKILQILDRSFVLSSVFVQHDYVYYVYYYMVYRVRFSGGLYIYVYIYQF